MDADLLRQISNGGVVTSDISSRSQYNIQNEKTGTKWTSPLWFSE
jgi:hypothetical protein